MKTWSVYLLTNGTRTYVGSTTDVKRRLRQHNGEIRGGARSTRGHRWELVAYVEGFENRSVACRWEKLIKLRARGLSPRISALQQVAFGMCPMKNRKSKHYEVPEELTYHYNEERARA